MAENGGQSHSGSGDKDAGAQGDSVTINNPKANIGFQIGKAELGSHFHYHESPPPPQITPPYFYGPGVGSRTFVGRETDLQNLHQLLTQSEQAAIAAAAGMGGIGKTELAWQYAHQHQTDYPAGIWWMAPGNWVGQILDYGTQMELPPAPDTFTTDELKVQWYFNQWLKALPQGQRLLVCDDVTEYREVKPLLPQDPRYRVLLTTRAKLQPPVQRLDLEVLSPEAALELLRVLVGDDDQRIKAAAQVASKLCAWVGRLPLGIELIGRHLRSRPSLPLAALLKRLQAQKLRAKAVQDVPEEMNYQLNLEAAFELSWQQLSSHARQLGGLLSVFALSPVARDWVVASLPDWESEQLEAAESELLQWSLASFPGGQYLLHTLIREFLAAKLDGELSAQSEARRRGMAVAMTAVAQTVPDSVTLSDLAKVQGAVGHWEIVAEGLTALLADEDAVWPFIALGRMAAGQNRWQEAQGWCQACLEMAQERFGESHPDTATSLNNLALLYSSMGRYEEALPLCQRSLEIRERELGESHPHTATSLGNLAELYRAMGRYEEALPLCQRSLEIHERKLGESHSDTAASFNNLAGLYYSMGRYEEALPLYQRSLAIRERVLGESHPHTATSLNNLALLYYSVGRHKEALPLCQRSLAICEGVLRESHPHTATSLNNLAGLYASMGRYEEAEPP